MNNGFEGDLEKTFEQFMELTSSEMNKALRKALRTGAKTLQTQTKSNLNSVIKTRNNPHYYDGKPIVYNDQIDDAVMISKIHGGGYGELAEEMSINVHVFGTKASGSGTFRARFLEGGTKVRTARYYRDSQGNKKALKKPRNLGRITPRLYFQRARASVTPNLEQIYVQSINEAIEKINNTK